MLAACSHLFHKRCILQATSNDPQSARCPLCRSEVIAAMPASDLATEIILIHPDFGRRLTELFPNNPTTALSTAPLDQLLE